MTPQELKERVSMIEEACQMSDSCEIPVVYNALLRALANFIVAHQFPVDVAKIAEHLAGVVEIVERRTHERACGKLPNSPICWSTPKLVEVLDPAERAAIQAYWKPKITLH